MTLEAILNPIVEGVLCGAFLWALLWVTLHGAAWLRLRGAFPELVLNAPAEDLRRELRRRENDLLLLASAAAAAISAWLAAMLFAATRYSGWLMWALFALACALFVAWTSFLVLGFMRWYQSRYAVRASAALGGVFARLSLQGHRVFHAMPLGDEIQDHVVIGARGAFVVRVLTRRPTKTAISARLHGRFVEFQDGMGLPAPVLSAERGARALADLSAKNLSHRINVRPVIALPGWEISPPESPVSEVLLINEKNAMMLLGWTKPADNLFDDDAAKLQELLVRLCSNPQL